MVFRITVTENSQTRVCAEGFNEFDLIKSWPAFVAGAHDPNTLGVEAQDGQGIWHAIGLRSHADLVRKLLQIRALIVNSGNNGGMAGQNNLPKKNPRKNRWLREIKRRAKNRKWVTSAFCLTLASVWGGLHSKMSVWRLGEIVVYGDPIDRIDTKPGFKDAPQPGVYANIRYAPGKAQRPIDFISNAATPVIVTHGILIPAIAGIACLRRRQR